MPAGVYAGGELWLSSKRCCIITGGQVVNHAIDTNLTHDLLVQDFAGPRRRALTFDARFMADSEKSGPFALVADIAYLLAAVVFASAFLAMLAIATPIALGLAAVAGIALGGEAPKAWRPVRAR